MDNKPNISISISRITMMARHIGGGAVSPDVMWKIILSALFAGAIAVIVFAYFTFLWAINVESPKPTSSSGKDAFSISELDAVIALYHSKEERYNTLLMTRPPVPSYAKGKGLVASSTDADIELIDREPSTVISPVID